MNCKGAEKFMLRLFDGRLSEEQEQTLRKHMKQCPSCREKERQYAEMFSILKSEELAEPLPFFEERLMSRIKEKKRYAPWSLWKWWSVRVVPASIMLICILLTTLVFFTPTNKIEMSQTGILLLSNTNPLSETNYLLEENNVEQKNMMLIFYAAEENIQTGDISHEK